MSKDKGGKGQVVIAVLSAAMFVYVIDTTLMNVSISALVEDLNTTVGEVQAAITLYTLTMAAFMLTGGKLGDIWGSKRAFRIGLVIYGIGTTVTAFAPTIGFVMIGWSILEGLGSALIVPAINTLVRANFDGSKRATAYGTLFGVAAAGAAFGPLIGGWVTTEYSWRYAFIGEAIIVVIVLLSSGLIADAPRVVPKPKLDQIGVVLSVSGMGMFVLGVLQTTTRGWTDPVVLGLIFGGLIVLGIFVRRAVGRERLRLPTLVRPSIFKSRGISVGLPVLSTQLFAQAGLLFLVPVFTQSVLGFDAFETGLTLLPLSIGVLVTSVSTPPLGRKIYPKYIIQTGLVLLFVGGFVLAKSLDGATSGSDLRLGLIIGGVAIGLVAGQLPNLILSSVDQDHASEASGLQGTFQNLGMALGTAVIGTVILTVALSSLQSQVEASTVFPDEIKGTLTTELEQSIDEMARAELGEYIDTLDSDQQAEAERIFETGTLRGFQGAIVVGGVVALLGGLLAFRLPKVKLRDDASIENTVKEIVRNPTVAKFHLEMEDFSTSTDSGP